MIGYFHDVQDLQDWAQRRGDQALADYAEGSGLMSLGYAMAMFDIAQSEVGEDVDIPPYQARLFDRVDVEASAEQPSTPQLERAA